MTTTKDTTSVTTDVTTKVRKVRVPKEKWELNFATDKQLRIMKTLMIVTQENTFDNDKLTEYDYLKKTVAPLCKPIFENIWKEDQEVKDKKKADKEFRKKMKEERPIEITEDMDQKYLEFFDRAILEAWATKQKVALPLKYSKPKLIKFITGTLIHCDKLSDLTDDQITRDILQSRTIKEMIEWCEVKNTKVSGGTKSKYVQKILDYIETNKEEVEEEVKEEVKEEVEEVEEEDEPVDKIKEGVMKFKKMTLKGKRAFASKFVDGPLITKAQTHAAFIDFYTEKYGDCFTTEHKELL